MTTQVSSPNEIYFNVHKRYKHFKNQTFSIIIRFDLILFLFSSTTVLSIGLVDFVVSIIQRYTSGGNGSIGYSAHIAGGVAGILIGMNVLRNFHHKVISLRCK